MNESIGMLSDAYFASRSVILQWLNALLGLDYTKVEQTASGVAVCQIFDALFPDTVRLDKVNFQARRDYEFIQNYKVLQEAFSRLGIEKQVDVQKLIKGKYQDNLEFMQWVKGFFDQHATESALEYDGAGRRAQIGKFVPATRTAPVPAASRRTAQAPGTASARRPVVSRPNNAVNRAVSKENRTANANFVKRTEYEALQGQVNELTQLVEEGETERDFYFNKLRNVEIIIQSVEDENPEVPLDPVLQQIKDILYMTEDDAGATGNVEGEVTEADTLDQGVHEADGQDSYEGGGVELNTQEPVSEHLAA